MNSNDIWIIFKILYSEPAERQPEKLSSLYKAELFFGIWVGQLAKALEKALHYPVVPKFSPVALISQIAGIFFSLLMATELAPQGNVVPSKEVDIDSQHEQVYIVYHKRNIFKHNPKDKFYAANRNIQKHVSLIIIRSSYLAYFSFFGPT